MITPLHAALGRTDADLTFDLVQAACEQKLAENDRLDWKKNLPLPVGEGGSDEDLHSRTHELAKDIAAMANTRGGLLVYGVREGSANRAEEIVDVGDLTGGEMAKRIRQVSYTYIYPPVQVGCHALALDSPDQDEKRVLIVEVPESDEAPHLVRPRNDGGNQGWLIAPYRAGADTQNMVEKQIETAYKQRIEGRQRHHRKLRELHAELVGRRASGPDRETGTVVALAQPIHPRRGALAGDRSQKVTAQTILDSATTINLLITKYFSSRRGLPPVDGLGAALLDELDRPRRSLRRHVFSASRPATNRAGAPIGLPAELCVELHDDGSVGFTWRRGTFYAAARDGWAPGAPSLGAGDMDMVAIALFALVLAVYEDLELVSDYQVRVSIVPDAPLYVVAEDNLAPDLRAVPPPPSVEAELRFTAGPDARASDVLMLAQDLNHMVEQQDTAFERFWETTTFFSETPIRDLALRVFGGEPDHPVTGRPMTKRP